MKLKLNKKEMIENAIKKFIPIGVTLQKLSKLEENQYNQLKSLKDAVEFSLNYKVFLGKVSKVVDGDTIKAIIFLNEVPTRFTFRLNGIDTPEIRKGDAK
jgi:endonuclease YncB( thermonuclease family)